VVSLRAGDTGEGVQGVAVSSENFNSAAKRVLKQNRAQKAAYESLAQSAARAWESLKGADLAPGVAVPSKPLITLREGGDAMWLDFEDGRMVFHEWPLVTAEGAWALPRGPSPPPACVSPFDCIGRGRDSAARRPMAAEGRAKKVRGSENRAKETASTSPSTPPLLMSFAQLPPLPRLEEPAWGPPARPRAGPRAALHIPATWQTKFKVLPAEAGSGGSRNKEFPVEAGTPPGLAQLSRSWQLTSKS